jgi:osmotically-inducible protein OsmY
MKHAALASAFLLIGGMASLSGCSSTQKSPDVTDEIKNSLQQAGLRDVSVSQDRDRGVVTLNGSVASDAEKAQAESIAKGYAASQVVSDQIAVRPPGQESMMKSVDSDHDAAIDKNFHAVLVQNKLTHDVKYDVKNGVVTLTGTVNSQGRRAMVQKLAESVPNVSQVVNELEVKGQKASSSR